MNFQDARLKLLAYVRNEVRNGELTERGFARLIGISQPHAHNVLKGARTLSPEVFDLVLKYLHLSLLDLAPSEEIQSQIERRRIREHVPEISFLNAPVGSGSPWPSAVNRRATFPAPLPSHRLPVELVIAKLTPDPAMLVTLAPYDIALLDTSAQRLSALSHQCLYVIERGNETVLRFVRFGARCLYLVSDGDWNRPAAWEPLSLYSDRFSEALKARVVWLGCERDRDAYPQRGRFLDDPISS